MLLFVRNVQSKNKAKVVKKCHNFWFKTIKQRYKILINLIFSWRENTKQTVFNSPLLKRTIYMQQFNYCNLLPYKLEKKAFNKSLPSKLKNEVEKIWACLMLSKNKTKKNVKFCQFVLQGRHSEAVFTLGQRYIFQNDVCNSEFLPDLILLNC